MNKIVIYTSIFSEYDQLHEPPLDDQIDYICFTDNKNFKSNIWKIILINEDLNIKILNRKFKFLPHKYLSQYEWSVYVDGNIRIMTSPSMLFSKYMNSYNIYAPNHPERNCIYDEAKYLLNKKKNNRELIKKQINKIKNENYPEKIGLNEFNIIIRKHNDPDIIKSMEEIWTLFQIFPTRDQLIFNYVLWKNNIQIGKIIESARKKNKYFKAIPHNNNIYLRKIFNIFWYRRYHNKYFFFISKIFSKLLNV